MRNTAISQVSGCSPRPDVTAHRDDARALVGERLAAVRYVNIDYVGMTRPELEGRGPRLIEDDQEWQQPSWNFGSFHSVDGHGELVPAADNVAVLFSPASLPDSDKSAS